MLCSVAVLFTFLNVSQLLCCGAEARLRHQEVPGEDCDYVEHFKMHLHPKKIAKNNNLPLQGDRSHRATTCQRSLVLIRSLIALPTNITITQVYADFMEYLLTHTRLYLRDYLLRDVWIEQQGKIELIVAHPNHWGYGAQTILEQAAVKTGVITKDKDGLARLHFVEEAEAAASFFLSEWRAVAERLAVSYLMTTRNRTKQWAGWEHIHHMRCRWIHRGYIDV